MRKGGGACLSQLMVFGKEYIGDACVSIIMLTVRLDVHVSVLLSLCITICIFRTNHING